ncbi:MAG: ATP-binding protein [Clostridium sp.]|nr:ATP-binding protein [Clostridium sp.]
MSNFHAKVMARYGAIRTKEEANQKARKVEIHQKIPRVGDLERLMSLNSLNVARNIARNVTLDASKNQEQVTNTIANLKSENLNLQQEKMELLVSHGYPMDYMELKYHCNLCQDTGYVSGKKCSCYKQLLAEIVYAESDFSQMLSDESFETFDQSLFDNDSIHPEYGLTVRQNMNDVLKIGKAFVRDFHQTSDSLYFYGPSGTGKTFLATCIARELLKEGQVVVYRTSSQLMDDIRDIKFQDDKEIETLLSKCDLLIIDDLGTEMPSDHSKTEIFNLINQRLLQNRKMIISSNLRLDSIRSKYSERLSSRIMGDFILVPFFGEDLRHIKGHKKNRRFRSQLNKKPT